MKPSESLAIAEQSNSLDSCLSEVQSSAAYLIGRCVSRKQIMLDLEIDSRTTLWRWWQIPEFQESVRRSNREWLSELTEAKGRIIARALEIEEASLAENANAERRAAIAHEIARNVIR